MTTPNIIGILSTCADDQSRGLIAIASKIHFKQISFDNLSHICDMIRDPAWKILILEQYQHILNADVTPQSLDKLLLTFAPEFHDRIKLLLKDKHVSWFDEPSTPRYIPEEDIHSMEPDEIIVPLNENIISQPDCGCLRNFCIFFIIIFIYMIFFVY